MFCAVSQCLLPFTKWTSRYLTVPEIVPVLIVPTSEPYSSVLNPVKKGKFLYSAVSSPQDRSKRFTLYFPDRPVHSDTISASLGSIQPYATINARRLLIHISTTVYSHSFIQLSELEQCRVNKLAQGFNTAARIQTRVLVVESPKLYP